MRHTETITSNEVLRPNEGRKIRQKPKIVLIGSRGIPPRYGGAETFVYELATRLKEKFDIYVTCETNRFSIDEFEGIKRIHIKAYHTPTITIPSIYDIIATLYTLKRVRDAKLFYYVAPDGALASVLARLAGKKVIVNTDGIEWQRLLKRIKFVPWHQKPLYLVTALFMLIMEFLACKIPHVTIADSIAIKKHLERVWRPRRVVYVSYGIRKLPEVSEEEAERILSSLGLKPYTYFLTIGRTVAENGIHLEIEALLKTDVRTKLVIVGPMDLKDPYIRYLFHLKEEDKDKRIVFTGSIYNTKVLAALRKYCLAYLHPYTVGGTNPSLLEQLQYDRPIIAYDVPFHKEVLRNKGIFFKTVTELAYLMSIVGKNKINYNYELQLKLFSWDFVSKIYLTIFKNCLKTDK